MVETTGMLLAAMSEWFSDTLQWRRVTGTIHGECTCNYLHTWREMTTMRAHLGVIGKLPFHEKRLVLLKIPS